MKKINSILLITSLLAFAACSDVPIASPKKSNTTIPSTFTTKVVLEKYTGEWCGACPSAGQFYSEKKSTDGTQFIGVAIHADDKYANPANEAIYRQLNSSLRHNPDGLSIGFPNVMFNRSKGPNDQVINGFGNSDWSSKFDELKAATVSSGLSLETSITGDTLTAAVKHYHKTALEGNYAITAYLVENELNGSDQVSAGADYKQQHVLRELLTPAGGIPIDATMTDEILSLELSSVDISAYIAGNLEVIAFIHQDGATFSEQAIVNGQIVKAGENQSFD
jgi:hypothetical protein